MAEEAEQKRLPASDKKLREARERGQVSQSKDLVSAFILTVALGYIYVAWPYTVDLIDELVTTISTPLGADGAAFWDVVQRTFRQSATIILVLLLPLVALIGLFTITFGWMATGGPVFSFETISPKFEHISPAEGLKKIFSRRNVIEFAKGLAKICILSAVMVAVLMLWVQPLFVTPACGESCIEPALMAMLIPLGVAVALAFIIIGILDVPIQRWLFLEEMQMTTTEYKREQKDMEGDPYIRQALQRLRKESVIAPSKVGMRNSVLLLRSGDIAVGLRYVKGDTPIPTIVAKGRDRIAGEMLAQAREMKIEVIDDPALTEGVFQSSRVGDFIEEAYFTPVVRHLIRLGLT